MRGAAQGYRPPQTTLDGCHLGILPNPTKLIDLAIYTHLCPMQKQLALSLLPLLLAHSAAWASTPDEQANDTPFYMSLGASRIDLNTQTTLTKGPSLLAGTVDSSTHQSLVKITAGKYVMPQWSVEASLYADAASGGNRIEVNQPAVGQLLSARVSTFTLSTHYHWFDATARIRPYAGATLARASFSSEQLGSFAQANGYNSASIDSVWGLGLSAGVQAKLSADWHLNLNYIWVPLKSQINVASSNPFAPAIQSDLKIKASGLSFSLKREF
jgi:outer membrane protein W